MTLYALFAATAKRTSLDDQVRAAATLASIILALLTLFTTRRAQKLAADRVVGIGALSLTTVLTVIPDLVLAMATSAVLAAMSHLFFDSFSIRHWTDRGHVVASLFSVAYLGFVALFFLQVGLAGWRLVVAGKNSLAR